MSEGADQDYLLAREADLWRTEADRIQSRLDALQEGSPEWVNERAWHDYCFGKHEMVAGELDKLQNPQKYSTAHVAHLDDLERQTE